MAIPVPEKRIKDFEEMGFGMFVHWGLYALLGQGEWIRWAKKIPKEEYCRLADDFAVTKFDGQELARIAKRAGAKYITITTRHHDGFSLYDTKGLDDFDAPHSAAKRDLIREFVDGCNAEGIKPFFYHTKLDWNHPTYHGDFKKYLQYLRDSIEVLCTQYGEIGGFWFDGNWDRPPETDWEDDQLYALIRRYQPNCIIVDNTGLERRGAVGNKELDSVTFEQGRPTPMDREGMDKYVAAEMCQTINQHWGYGKADFNYKSLAYLIETLCACRKVGANYLLNVGPDGDGVVPAMQAELMAGIGDWIRTCGSSIYKAKPCGVTGTGKNFALQDGDKIYFYIHDLSVVGDSNVVPAGGSAGEKAFSGLPGKISNLHWVDNGEVLEFRQDGGDVTMNCTGYEYGVNLVVRVAEADLEA